MSKTPPLFPLVSRTQAEVIAEAETVLSAIAGMINEVPAEDVVVQPEIQLGIGTTSLVYCSHLVEPPGVAIREYVTQVSADVPESVGTKQEFNQAVEEFCKTNVDKLRRAVSASAEMTYSFELPQLRAGRRLWKRWANISAAYVVLKGLELGDKRPGVLFVNHSLLPDIEEMNLVVAGERALHDKYLSALLSLLHFARARDIVVIGIAERFENTSLIEFADSRAGKKTGASILTRPSSLFGNDYILLNGCDIDDEARPVSTRTRLFPDRIMRGPKPLLKVDFTDSTLDPTLRSELQEVGVIYLRSSRDGPYVRAEFFGGMEGLNMSLWKRAASALDQGYVLRDSTLPKCLTPHER